MVIYDTENNYNGKILGTLYLSVADAEYLEKKYTTKELYNLISYDYAETIHEEADLASMEGPLSVQYYAAITLGIENERDERLIKILREEILEGNLFTKSSLEGITESVANDLITELLKDKEVSFKSQIKEGLTRVTYQLKTYDLTLEELYKLRSYEMVKYILRSIDEANRQRSIMNESIGNYDFNDEKAYHRANDKLLQIIRNLENLGLSGDIKESTYFKADTPTLAKK